MKGHYFNRTRITAENVLAAYRQGVFPMAEGLSGAIRWYVAPHRALIPLDERFTIRRSLRKILQRRDYHVTFNTCFEQVIRACARHGSERETAIWLSEEMIDLYSELHRHGFAHSVEIRREDKLIGGLYGMAIGALFCGESMFSAEPFGSQIALVSLVERLRERGFQVLDAQIISPHLMQFGAYEVLHEEYLELIAPLLKINNVRFD